MVASRKHAIILYAVRSRPESPNGLLAVIRENFWGWGTTPSKHWLVQAEANLLSGYGSVSFSLEIVY